MGDSSTQHSANPAADTITNNTVTDRQMTSGPESTPPDDPPVFRYRLDENDAYRADIEDLYHYLPGGYHPVALGDVLGGRFRVVHKLGWGGYATVWLCHDNVSKKWRAVKIMAADKSTPDCADIRAHERFESMIIDSDVLAANHVQLPLEHFWLDGPNGRHLCFVLPLLGPRLSSIYHLYGRAPELMKDICFQLIEALKFIHWRGLCHGDFRPENILFRLVDGVDEWEEEAILELLGKPALVRVEYAADESVPESEIERDPTVPAYLVDRGHISHTSGACSSAIAVTDLGVSHPIDLPPVGKGTGIPFPYAAPEQVFGLDHNLGFQTDVWALGVTIAKVRCGILPFAVEDDDLLTGVSKMECIMGPLPEPYQTVWKDWDGAFVNCRDKDGKPHDDDSWKDVTVFATMDLEEVDEIRQSRLREGRSPFWLLYRLQGGLIMDINQDEAADIAAQAAADPGRLPTLKRREDAGRLPFEELVKHRMPDGELNLMLDLFLKIFRWHPGERATLDEIANHEWFGERNRYRPLWPAWSPHRARLVMTALVRNGADRTARRVLGLLESVGRTVSDAVGRWRSGSLFERRRELADSTSIM